MAGIRQTLRLRHAVECGRAAVYSLGRCGCTYSLSKSRWTTLSVCRCALRSARVSILCRGIIGHERTRSRTVIVSSGKDSRASPVTNLGATRSHLECSDDRGPADVDILTADRGMRQPRAA